MTIRRRTAAITALTAAALLAAGCSNSGGSGASGGSSKSPIRLMVDTTMTPAASLGGLSFPYPVTGAKAAAAALNAKGGIDGHQVQIDVCDNQGSPDQSAACARRAKSNGDIAVIGSFDVNGASQLVPVLQAEGIPYVGSEATNPVELSSPDSFSFDPAAVVGNFATVGVFKQQGCKNIVEFAPASAPSVQQIIPVQQAQAKALGLAFHTVNVNTGQADVTAPVSTAMGMHPDCATYVADGQTAVKIIIGMHQAGWTGKYVTGVGSLLPAFLKALGSQASGIDIIAISTSVLATVNDPQVNSFRSQVTAYTGSASAAAPNLTEFSQDAWSSVQLVDQALTGTGSYTSAELLKKLPTMCDVNIGNVYPHIDFCKPAATSSVFPRIFNDWWRYYAAKDGEYVPLNNTWYNHASTIPAGA